MYAFSIETLESIVKRYARQNLYHKDKWEAKLFRWHLKFFYKELSSGYEFMTKHIMYLVEV